MSSKTGRGRVKRDYSRQAAAQAKTIQAMAQQESQRQREQDAALIKAWLAGKPIERQGEPE